MEKYINKDALVAKIEIIFKEIGIPPHEDSNCEDWSFLAGEQQMCKIILSLIDTLEVKEYSKKYEGFLGKELKMVDDEIAQLEKLKVKGIDISNISENLAEADEYLDYTHTSNLAHNKPMVSARLRRAIKELYNAGLFKLTHDEKYRMERLELKL